MLKKDRMKVGIKDRRDHSFDFPRIKIFASAAKNGKRGKIEILYEFNFE
jgi:hypothetical protein